MDAKDDPGGHGRAKAAHERAAKSKAAHERTAKASARAAAVHEESANLHEQHAAHMREKGYPESVERAEQIADRERELADRDRRREEKHVRLALAEPIPET